MGTSADENARIRLLIELDKSTLPPDGGTRFNRLIFATSPYLLQHAENPVDWYQWGDEAFAAARQENKPVFLSIGYATCHWCHVMAHESFEDPEVAEVLNRQFISVKVDREERPDIDAQYMTVAQMMTGSGGWPLTVVMTPEREPFFAATYLPRTARMGMPGVITILNRIAHFWRSEPDKVAENCASIIETLIRYHRSAGGTDEDPEAAWTALRQLGTMYDREWGGFGESPKFPMPFNAMFLLRAWKKGGEGSLLGMVEHTLRQMRNGGIFDQIGFGFHRYSVDRQWLVPHFEKMLYDQALLAHAYLEACQATGDVAWRQVAEEIFTFVLRDLTSSEGAFHAALDADSEGVEGKFYVWTPEEVRKALGDSRGDIFCSVFDITEAGNFEGKNIPHLPLPLAHWAQQEGVNIDQMRFDLEQSRELLLAQREQRVRPFRDEKILTAWNGMMIAALVKGYAVCGKSRYLHAAERCADFILARLINPAGRLMRSFHLGRAVIPAFLEDYAGFIWGLTSLYEVTGTMTYGDHAVNLSRDMLRLFCDGESGMCYDSGSDTEEILMRISSVHDGVVPSGNSLAAYMLCRLGRARGDDHLMSAGHGIIKSILAKQSQQPVSLLALLMAREYAEAPPVEVTVAGPADNPAARDMMLALHRRFIPNLAIRHVGGSEVSYPAVGGAPTMYLCADGACRPPVTTVPELMDLLDKLA